MRVAFISHWPPETGIGRIIYSLFEAILENHHDIEPTMFSLYPSDLKGIFSDARKNTITLNPIPFRPAPFDLGGNINRLFTLLVGSRLIPRDYDVYHISDHMIGLYAGSLHPSIVMATDVSQCQVHSIEQAAIPALYNALLSVSINSVRKADGVMAISKFGMRDVINTLGIPPRKFGIVYPGVDHKVFFRQDKQKSREALGLPVNRRIVLHVGTEIPTKNVPVVLRAFARIKKEFPDSMLVRVGRPLPSSARLIRQLGIQDSVRYFEHLSSIPLASAYSSADVFVFPSSYEGFGLPPVEAMACGCPTIVGSCEAMKEVVSDGGEFVTPTDDEALSSAITRTLKLDWLSNDLAERGIRRAGFFEWRKSADILVNFYHEVINTRSDKCHTVKITD